MRRYRLCAAVAAFLMLSGHAFAFQNAQGQPSQSQAQQQQEQQAAPASPAGLHLRARRPHNPLRLVPHLREIRWQRLRERRASRRKIKRAQSRHEYSTTTIFPRRVAFRQ